MSEQPPDDSVGSDGLTDAERAEIKARSKRLGERLKEFTERPTVRKKSKRASAGGQALGHALRMAVDPIVGVLVGLGLGLLADNALGTKPLFLIIGLLLGGAAGMLNLVRSAERASKSKNNSSEDEA